MKKGTIDTQWVITPTRQRLATSRKRALRSRSVRAVRSVCSEYRSRTIQPRKFHDRWGLPDHAKGDSIALAATAMASEARPGSETVAEVYVQRLLEHSSPDLTNKVYTNVDPVLRSAVDQMPVTDWLTR